MNQDWNQLSTRHSAIRHRVDEVLFGTDRLAAVMRLTRELDAQLQFLWDTYGERIGLTQTELRVMDLIGQHWEHPLTMGGLAQLLGLSTGTTTGIVDRLEQHGYVKRVRDATDRRRVHLEVTHDAEQTAIEFFTPFAQRLRAALADFEADDLDVVVRFLRETVSAVALDPEAAAERARQAAEDAEPPQRH